MGEISVLLIFFLSFFLFLSFFYLSFFLSFCFTDELNLESIVCMRIYTYQTTALLPGILLFWFGTVSELRLASYDYETASYFSRDASRAWSSTSGASVQFFHAWHIQSGHTPTTELVELRPC